MPAQDIEYIELYTNDEHAALDYLVSSLAFTRVAESAASGSHSVLLRQGGVQLIVTEGPATRDFLDTHGDGIADIAFACDDVAETFDRAVAAGALIGGSEAGGPVVSGFGDTRHTLVASSAGSCLPAGRTWTYIAPPPAGRRGRSASLITSRSA